MKKVYRTLSIRRPFADEIAAGGKRIENRDWGASITGDIALHACGPDGGYIMGIMHVREVIPQDEARKKYPSQGRWISGSLCWVLDRYTPLPEPVRVRGHLGLWPSPPIEPAATAAWEGIDERKLPKCKTRNRDRREQVSRIVREAVSHYTRRPVRERPQPDGNSVDYIVPRILEEDEELELMDRLEDMFDKAGLRVNCEVGIEYTPGVGAGDQLVTVNF